MGHVLTRDQVLDWLAVYEIDPWGQSRQDIRAAVSAIWARGGSFDDLHIEYPHASDSLAISDEDEFDAIEQIAAAQERERRCPNSNP